MVILIIMYNTTIDQKATTQYMCRKIKINKYYLLHSKYCINQLINIIYTAT